ncbi:hypothetical protein POPTR_002G061100v4 [Populus trichocarpa]|uniref:Shikimate kinase n=1 Tax=Populus trichocarpa TaxID=3694 RepID=B9GT47_POPTR|nr:shikimate kinase 3, chloroplastic [Populus trichocarpa]PNT48101.1 hypothetical protein POPTR_002G061100v4 [Populus trichocarpa]|eukprot:XP_002302148.2 shikimate kinase 3, chloroplastic isoform X1 [Populus trichocarpa]
MQPKELQLCTSYIISYRFCHPPLILIQCRMARRCMINYDTPRMESGDLYAFFDERLLKKKAKELAPCLNSCCIFLIGMMGCGKTTVGKVLSEALGYAFVDSDTCVEQAVGEISVAQIFQKHGESVFRDNESKALQELSLKSQQVVATGDGAVLHPINWEYMRKGITVFLDVPLDALARRIAAVGTDSRPLLDFDSGDPYTKALMRLSTLLEKRVEKCSSADVTVSLSKLADDLEEDVSHLTPTIIAIEVLEQIEKYLRGKKKTFN